jgi:outer membrane usher protein
MRAAGGEIPPEQLRDELFRQVFKHPPPSYPVSGHVVVVIDGGAGQKVPAVLSPGARQVLVDGHALSALLRPMLQPDALQQVEQRMDADGRLDVAALQAAGLQAQFDPRKFELSLTTPPGKRGTMVSHLSPPPLDPFSVEAVRPAGISGFLSFNLKGSAQSGTGRPTAATLALDGALNLHGVVLEGTAYGQTGHPGSWQRGDLRLVYDQPRRALRFTAGDLSYPVVGYQRMTALLGLGLARDFALQPQQPTWRTNDFEFYLERPAEVKVWVNDSLVNTLRLPAGAHDIRGLNAAVGLNDARLVIEDDAGRRETLEFTFLFNPVLLEKGRSTFSWNAGFRRVPGADGYRYDLHQPMLSGSYLTGWTDRTTLGAYMQAEEARSLLGLRALHTCAVGTLQLDAALSRTDPAPWDAGLRLELIGNRPARGGLQSQLALEYLGRYFGTTPTPDSSATLGFRASVAAPLGPKTIGRLSGSYSPARRTGSTDSYLVGLTLTRRWNRWMNGSVALRQRRTDRNPAVTEALFSLSLTFTRDRATIQATKELETNTVATRWDSGRPGNASAPYGFAELRRSPDSREYRGGAGYAGYRGLAELTYRHTETGTLPGWQAQNETALRLQGALVFADGVVALARPVTENFAIVTGTQGLRNVPLRVDPDAHGGSRGRSDWAGPAVIEDLASYQLRDVRIEPVNPPLGATPDKTVFTLAPTYKSGLLLRLGREPQIVALGRLVGDQHEPLAHCTLEIRRLDRPGEPPVLTFTGRNGAFQLPDIRPGRYEIRVAGETDRSHAVVEIPANPANPFRLGEILLPRI